MTLGGEPHGTRIGISPFLLKQVDDLLRLQTIGEPNYRQIEESIHKLRHKRRPFPDLAHRCSRSDFDILDLVSPSE